MKFAIATVTDQTISYLTKNKELTTKHPLAGLWDDITDASILISELSVEQALSLKNPEYEKKFPYIKWTDEEIIETCHWWLEIIEDENEFRNREDTW